MKTVKEVISIQDRRLLHRNSFSLNNF